MYYGYIILINYSTHAVAYHELLCHEPIINCLITLSSFQIAKEKNSELSAVIATVAVGT